VKYRKLRNARKAAANAGVDFIYVCCLLSSLQRVRNLLHETRLNNDDLKDFTKIEKSLIKILDYVGAEFVIDDWDQVKRGEAR
jgi:hypothetical protein